MKLKTITSFIKRERRLPINKQKILAETWPTYGLELTTDKLSIEKTFNNTAPLILEIGFGTGSNLIHLATKYQNYNFIGIEVYRLGIVSLLTKLKSSPLKNIRIYNNDAVAVLKQTIPNKALEKVLVFFPDPWPKNRHHKRRLLQKPFIDLIHKKLKPQGILHIATDWEDYANHINNTLKNSSSFIYADIPTTKLSKADRILTKFEQRGQKKGHQIFDLIFIAK